MSNKMTSFFKPKATEPEPEMLHWKTTKPRGPGSTARIEVFVKARVGSYVTHAVHGKVKLLGQPAPDKLEVEIKTDTSQWPVPGGIITMRNIGLHVSTGAEIETALCILESAPYVRIKP